MNLTVSQVTVTDGLLTSMKINCDIYCHRAPPLLITNPTVSVNNLRWEVPVSSHQRTQRLRREVLRSTKMFIDSADSQMSAAEECDMSWVKCHLTGLKKILKTFLGRFKDS